MTTDTIQLSRWWTTPSAQRAFARASEQRRERIQRMRSELAERKAEQDREFKEWEATQ